MRKIVCPTDFSASCQEALEVAAALAKERGATLLIVHVAEISLAYGGEEFVNSFENFTDQHLKRKLSEVAPADPTIPCERALLNGVRAEAIVGYAEREGAELIVMSTHGRTGVSRVLMGSVAEGVVRQAKCPVLTLKPSAPAEVV